MNIYTILKFYWLYHILEHVELKFNIFPQEMMTVLIAPKQIWLVIYRITAFKIGFSVF
jgi:uncharacterized membrane protein (DUF106 family)